MRCPHPRPFLCPCVPASDSRSLPASHQEWFTVYERNRHTSCTVSDLIVGNEYYFRVYSENICGLSDSPGVSKNTARILKTGTAAPLPWGPVSSLGWASTLTPPPPPPTHRQTR